MTLAGYVRRDLLRNPRRTLASLVGVVVGVGLFSAVLFFIDGSGASMTRRALAPLTLDLQRVLGAPVGGGIRLQRTVRDRTLDAAASTVVTLTVANDGLAPAHEVSVRDQPAAPLAYVPGSTTLDGRPVTDPRGGTPLAQGSGGTGLNIGTVAPAASRQISYRVSTSRRVASTAGLPLRASISTREALTPARANAPRPASAAALAAEVGRLAGVASADPLVSVDMAAGAISAHGAAVPGPVKLFAFDAAYRAHYPSIRLLSGGQQPGGVLVSAETARALKLTAGDAVTLTLPGGSGPLSTTVTGITDLSTARPLFESREASSLERFVYVPYTIVVGRDAYRDQVAPAFERAAAAREAKRKIGSLPLEEVDIRLDRATLNADPATALGQTRRISAAVGRVAPGQDYLIDNVSNTLQVAKGDAAVAKRMFVFLGLPGAILAAILTAYAGTLLASAQRRESALLRLRGADRRQLQQLLGLRTLAIAGIGSLLGTALGFASVLVLLGGSVLLEASTGALLQSAVLGVLGGMLVTAVALYVPGRRLIAQEIKPELAVIARRATPGWRRLHLDLAALLLAGAAQLIALRAGAFDVPAGSVYAGRSVSLPLQLLIAPIVAWLAGTLLIAHVLHELVARTAVARSAPRFRRLLPGLLWRSTTRRLGSLTSGVVAVALVVALGTTLACFATVYDNAKLADARFLVGSDIRVTPNPTSAARHPARLARQMRVAGAGAGGATAVVFAPENAVLTSDFNEDVATLAAIDPRALTTVGALQDSLFVDGSTARQMAALERHPDGVLVNAALADGLKLGPGDRAQLLLARGTDQQTRKSVRVLGRFTQFPGAPKGTDVVANLGFYQRETGLDQADYYLVSSTDRSAAGLAGTARALATLPGARRRFDVQTSSNALDREQSSLTALNVRGLLKLDSFFTFLMAATATAMFVFGLLMQRRREYVTLRAQGLQTREIRRLVLAEAGLAATLGALIGVLVGVGMASQFVHVLRPIFTLPPPLQVPAPQLAVLAALVLAATALSTAAAAFLIGRLKPTELLRDE